MADPINILYLEDSLPDARLVKEMLSETKGRYLVTVIETIGGASEYLNEHVPDIILADMSLPDSQGMDTFRRIHALSRRIPIIVLSGLADEEVALATVQEGAQDYLVKGRFDAELLVRSIRYAIERDRAARALAESETRYRGVSELVPFGTWTASPDGAVTYLSDIFLDMIGMTLDECLPDGWTGRVHPEDAPEMAAAWKRCIQDETPWEYQYRIRDRFGEYRTVLSRGTPVLSYRGQVLSWSGINLDVSERASYIQTLNDSKQQMDTVVNATHVLLAYMDPEFNFIWVNRAYAEADGKDPSFFPGKNHFDLFPYGQNREVFLEVVRTGEPYYAYARAFEYADHPERGVSYWDWTLIPTKNEQGDVTGVLFSLADVTERIRMQDSLKISEEKYRLLVESANSVITVTQDGVIRFVNEQVKEILGYRADELIGKETSVVFGNDFEQKAMERPDAALPPSAYQIRHKNGDNRYVQVIGTLMMWEGRPALLCFVTDITERKRTEAFIQKRGELFEYAVSHSLQELLQKTLDEAGELTGSPIGFYHFVQSDQQTLSLQAWSTRTTREFCTAPGKGMHYGIGKAGVWVDCVRERRPVIHNDYSALAHKKGFPEGHPAVVRELVVPVMRSGQIMAILGVGNKATDYDQKDVQAATYLADVAWEIAERKLADEALRESEARYHSLFANMLDGFAYHRMIYDEEDRPVDYLFLETNDAFERLTGLRDVVGKRITEIIPGIRRDNPEIFETYGRVALTSTPEEFETYVPALDRWFSVSVYSPAKAFFVTVFDNITERKNAQEQINRAHEDLKLALKVSEAGAWDWDIENDRFIWSEEFFQIFGMDPKTTPGFDAWNAAVHPDDRQIAAARIQDAIDTKQDLSSDYRVVLPGGEIRWIRAIGKTFYNRSRPTRMIGLCMDITRQKRADEAIAQSLAEKEALLREIHHRVKNNLQTVSSLLAMAGMSAASREAAALLRDAESRVHAMALIHSQLYGSQRLDRIDVKRNIRELTDRLSSIYSETTRRITHSVEGDDVFLTIHQAIPCALAVNEIVTNAFKYAFEGKKQGAIDVRVGQEASLLSITIADNGIGLPDGFDVESSETLGVRLVKNLIEGQLAGKVGFSSSGGASVTISFAVEPQAEG